MRVLCEYLRTGTRYGYDFSKVQHLRENVLPITPTTFLQDSGEVSSTNCGGRIRGTGVKRLRRKAETLLQFQGTIFPIRCEERSM